MAGRAGIAIVCAALAGIACAHSPPVKTAGARIGEGRYAVESIRSRAAFDGIDQLVEISEAGSTIRDRRGAEHTLTERGALTLGAGGVCRLALAVSVDGQAPGIAERTCSWSIEGGRVLLGEEGGGPRTLYRVHKDGDRYLLEGLEDRSPDGRVLGDARGERLVLVEGRGPLGSPPAAADAAGRAEAEAPFIVQPDEI